MIDFPRRHDYRETAEYPDSSMSIHFSLTACGKRTVASILAFLLMGSCRIEARTFAVNYAAEPDSADLMAFDMMILHPEARVNLEPGHAIGRKYLAYLSVVEVDPNAPNAPAIKEAGIPLLADNPEWKTRCADVTHPAWSDLLVGKFARAAVDKGYDGFFLDTLDSIGRLAREKPERAAEYRQAMISLIVKLRAAFPGKEIIVNRGFDLWNEIKTSVDGILIESVFQSFDSKGQYGPVAAGDHQALIGRIHDFRAAGVPVYVVDYLERGNPGLAESVTEQIRKIGAEPFLTTRELQGALLGPVQRQARRILVIYGSVLAESEVAEKFAADTFTAERLQMPLEWMGYEVEYVNVGKLSPPLVLDDRFCGIIFDVETQLPFGGEAWYVDWITEQKKRGLKILFTGQYPFQQDVQRARLFKSLGVWGSYAQVRNPQKVELLKLNRDLMSFEGRLTAHPAEMEDSRAPEGAQVDVSVGGTDEKADQLVFDAVFTCDWGGVLMEPYATFQASAEDQASLFDPFKYLQRLFPGGAFPAPDPTTRDGQRIFYSHIDGDGFCGSTGHAGNDICGAVIRDRILKKYPFPITISLVEASMKALEVGQDPQDIPLYEAVARECLALPNIQAASHSFSHPYVWIDDDEEFIPLYESRGLELKPDAGYDSEHPVMKREVTDSIAYVQSLCPPGKIVDLMLWSGNCRPSPEALRLCREAGIENMNGGNTVISKRHPFLSNVSPRIMQWDGELQIHAANQNEFVYTKNWSGPFYGGFAQVVETFDATESPRRLKPVNIYYHFYSALTLGALRAVEKVHDWALERPLHSLTASEYARLIKDSYETRIYRQGPRQWVMVNHGHQRTFRLDASEGIPDLTSCQHVTGWRKIGNYLYVHTDGSPVTQLTLADSPPPQLHLESCQGEITWKERAPARMSLTVTDLRPNHTLTFAGSAPGQRWRTTINSSAGEIQADGDGRVSLELHGNAEVQVAP